MSKQLCSFLLFLVALLVPIAALADPQESGSVSGIVKTSNGEPIANAKLTLLSAQQAVLGRTESDPEGRFQFNNVPKGSYAIEATKPDYDDQRVAAQLTSGGAVEVAIQLSPATISEQVTVTAETGQVQGSSRIPQQVNVIDRDLLKRRTTAVLAQAANEEEGIHLQRTSPSLGSIYVRGLTGRYVSVFVDGVRYTTGSQRGGINTFFNLNEPSNINAMEVLRGPNSAQYGSGALGGSLQLVSNVPAYGSAQEFHGDIDTFYNSADNSFGGNTELSYGQRNFGVLFNLTGRRVNTLRPGQGIDSHSSLTRFLGIRSDILGTRLTDTAFTQYGGLVHLSYAPALGNQITVHYQRNQQDGGKRYDQTLGGDGNLIADLRNLMLDFGYLRYDRQGGFFDNSSFTFSYNSQREERVNQGGQGNPLGSITSQFERTNVFGFNFYLDKRVAKNSLVIGADIYHERVDSPAFTFSPVTNRAVSSRPRIPDNAKFLTYGFYIQDSYELVPERLRLSGALRYSVASYKVRAIDSPIVNNQPLFPNDSVRVDDFSGRVGLVVTAAKGFDIAFNYSRGFNAPNTTELGTLGLTGDGFEIATSEALRLGGQLGNMAGDKAVSTGIAVSGIRSEYSNNFDLSLRYRNNRVRTNLTGFITDIIDPIVKQSLILPQGAVGQFLGDQPIVRQLPTGAVFVPLSASPVLVRTNFGDARTFGFEYDLEARLTSDVTFSGTFTYLRAKDKATGLPPNIEGGTPAPTGFLSLRYAPVGKHYWIEVYGNLVGDQERLSSLDLADRRTGASRSRTTIANFFNNGARVRGLIGAGPDGISGNSDDVLLATGETVTQIQNRLLGSQMSAPLFNKVVGYGLINLRGGFRIGENSDVTIIFSNIADKSYRGINWGVDGPGRSITVRYGYRF